MKPLDPEKLAALAARAERLGRIKDHPSWHELRALFEERREKHYASLTSRLLAGAEIDQRQIDRTAGFFRGAEWILNNPDQAQDSLKRALEKAERLQAITEEVTS